MKNKIERRRHIRVPLDIEVILNTPKGTIEVTSADISVSGLGVNLNSEIKEIGDEFQVLLKAKGNRELSLDCEKMWSSKFISGETMYDAIGFQFTHITPNERDMIASMVENYFLN